MTRVPGPSWDPSQWVVNHTGFQRAVACPEIAPCRAAARRDPLESSAYVCQDGRLGVCVRWGEEK